MNRRHFLHLATSAALGAYAAEPERRLRVAVIGHTGLGDYGHGLDVMWKGLPETEVIGFSDADEAGRAREATKLPGVPAFADYRQLLAETKPDLVAVCPRQMGEHFAMCMAAIESGARGLYIEKPLARSLAEADGIIAAAAARRVKIAVAHRNRYHPALVAVDKLLEEGTLGRILEIRARGKEDARGGAQDLWVLGSHVLNLVAHFGGVPRACTALLYEGPRPAVRADVKEGSEGVGPVAGNAVHACFEMERGFPAYFDSVQNAGDKAAGFGLQVIGTKGLIDLRMDTTPLAHFVPGNPFLPGAEPRPWIPITSAGAGQPEPIADVRQQVMGHLTGARDLLAAIREDRPPLCSGAEARLSLEMTFAIFASHLQNGARVTFPLAAKDNPLQSWRAE